MAHAGFFLPLVEAFDGAFSETAYSDTLFSITASASWIRSSVTLSLVILSRCSAARALKFCVFNSASFSLSSVSSFASTFDCSSFFRKSLCFARAELGSPKPTVMDMIVAYASSCALWASVSCRGSSQRDTWGQRGRGRVRGPCDRLFSADRTRWVYCTTSHPCSCRWRL